MEAQQTGKRSITLAITLVLLVFSLMGNVFLYSQLLQHKQQNKFETGEKVFKAISGSQQYVIEMIPQLEGLLQSKSLDERTGIIFGAGYVSSKGENFVDFTAELAEIMGQPEKFNTELPSAFLRDVENGLQNVGHYEGALNAKDHAYITGLIDTFNALNGFLSPFNTNIGESRSAIIRLSSGLEWSTILEESLLPIMKERSVKLSQ